MDIKSELSSIANVIFSKDYVARKVEKKEEAILENVEDYIESIVEEVIEEVEVSQKPRKKKKINESVKEVNETTSLDFIGSFNYIPNPLEQKKNALYKNINEGRIYVRNDQGLWESFLSDGKNGQSPKAWPSGGGLGDKDVLKSIYNNAHPSISLKTNVLSTTPSATMSDLVSFPIGFVGNILGLEVYGPAQSALYVVSANIYTTNDDATLALVASSSITNVNNADGAIILNLNRNTKYAADITLASGSLTSGVTIKVVS